MSSLYSPPQLPPYIPLPNLSLYNSPLSSVSVHVSMDITSSTGARETYVHILRKEGLSLPNQVSTTMSSVKDGAWRSSSPTTPEF